MNDLRDAYFNCLLEQMNLDPQASMLLTVDMGARSFQQKGNARIINMGVAEANAVTTAAGLSSRGVTTFVYGISAFLLNRARAQIRHDAVIGGNPVHLIGSGPGLSYDRDGPSHHSLDDIALMRTLPDTMIYSPFDRTTSERAVMGAMQASRTTYCRLDRGSYPEVSARMSECNGIYYRQRDTTRWIICSGVMTHQAMAISDQDDCSVASLFEIRPGTVYALSLILQEKALITIMDETHDQGGLFQLVAETNLTCGLDLILGGNKRLQNRIVQEKLPRDKLYEAYSA